jgi:WD40 repeat protein
MSLAKSSGTAIFALAASVAPAHIGHAQAVSRSRLPSADSSAVYSGVYASTFNESLFSPCDVPGIGSGWWLRFQNDREGAFLRYQYGGPGMATLSHFIRVRGRVSAPGHYGLVFQTREIVVDSVLDIKETPQLCSSYEDLPQPWEAIKPSGGMIIGAAIADDKVLAAVFDLEGAISIWNTARGTLVKRFQSEDKGDLSWGSRVTMEFTRDGKRLAVAGADGFVRIWNPVDGRRIWTFTGSVNAPGMGKGQRNITPSLGLALNQSGTLLANTVGSSTAIWSMVSGERVGTFKEGWWTPKVLFIGDSSFIASGDSGLMKIYPRFGAAPIWRVRTSVQQFDVMDRSADGRWLVVKSWVDTAYLWSLSEGLLGARIPIPNSCGRGAIAFSPDGNTIAMSGGANGLYLWDTKTGQPLRSFQKYPMCVQKAWFTPDGRSIVSYSMADTVFRIVHLDQQRGRFGNLRLETVQAWWPANSWPPSQTAGRTLGSIFGFVRDSSKKAIVGADVSIFDGDKPGSAPIGRTTTNAAGRFLLQAIKVRHVTVRAAKRGFVAEVKYTHLPAQGASVDFNLKADTGGS